MIPVTQTKVVVRNSNNDIIVNGNCYAAAIASMLEVPITEVPNIEMFFGTSFDHEWLMNAWLKEKHNVKIDFAEEYEIFHVDFITNEAPEVWALLENDFYFGIGPSSRGVNHICIYKAGRLIHDPHPTREGLLRLERLEKIVPLVEGESQVAKSTDIASLRETILSYYTLNARLSEELRIKNEEIELYRKTLVRLRDHDKKNNFGVIAVAIDAVLAEFKVTL